MVRSFCFRQIILGCLFGCFGVGDALAQTPQNKQEKFLKSVIQKEVNPNHSSVLSSNHIQDGNQRRTSNVFLQYDPPSVAKCMKNCRWLGGSQSECNYLCNNGGYLIIRNPIRRQAARGARSATQGSTDIAECIRICRSLGGSQSECKYFCEVGGVVRFRSTHSGSRSLSSPYNGASEYVGNCSVQRSVNCNSYCRESFARSRCGRCRVQNFTKKCCFRLRRRLLNFRCRY